MDKPRSKRAPTQAVDQGAMKDLARALFSNDIAKERTYFARDYQVDTAIRATELIATQQNVAIQLPTGVGKTLIACLIAAFWKQISPSARVLLVVPSRMLVLQHFEVARWVAHCLQVDRLIDKQAGDPGWLWHTLMTSDLIVSTPGILASAMNRLGSADYMNTIQLVIVDEFDQFVVVDEAERETEARYAEHWDRLSKCLPTTTRYVVKSATLGLDPSSPSGTRGHGRNRLRSKFIARMLAPVMVNVSEADYAAFVPLQRITIVRVIDPVIDVLLQGTLVSKGIAHLRLDKIVGRTLDYRDVERRATVLCQGAVGRIERLRLAIGGYQHITMTAAAQGALSSITKLLMLPQHIREDLTLGFDFDYGNCFIKTSENGEAYLADAPTLQDFRDDGHLKFQAGEKTQALIHIVGVRSSQSDRGLVMVRTVTLLNALRPILEETGVPVFELTGEKTDDERQQALSQFRQTSNGVLLMTRTTGGRGVDLPFAQYAVFYSPKSEAVTMWQEMSRIRSTVSSPKETYVLCCGDDEVETVERVVDALRSEARRVETRHVHLQEVELPTSQ